jgi:hypothetical protein
MQRFCRIRTRCLSVLQAEKARWMALGSPSVEANFLTETKLRNLPAGMSAEEVAAVKAGRSASLSLSSTAEILSKFSKARPSASGSICLGAPQEALAVPRFCLSARCGCSQGAFIKAAD